MGNDINYKVLADGKTILGQFSEYSSRNIAGLVPAGYNLASLNDLARISLDERNFSHSPLFAVGRRFVADDVLNRDKKGNVYFGRAGKGVTIFGGDNLEVRTDQFGDYSVTQQAFGEYSSEFGNLLCNRFGKDNLLVDLHNMCLEKNLVPVLFSGISGDERLCMKGLADGSKGDFTIIGVPKK